MRVSKSQIVKGVTEYIQGEVLPKMDNDKAVQIILSIAINAALANGKMVDAVFANEIVRSMLDDDGTGTYEINGVADAMTAAVQKYGSFPVKIPAIPLISPREITLTLNATDVEAMRLRIENA